MKKTKVKKIKNIPKYGGGTPYIPAGLQKDFSFQFNAPQGMNMNSMSQGVNGNTVKPGAESMPNMYGISALNTGMGVAAASAPTIASLFGIHPSEASYAGQAIGKAVGLIDPVAGLAVETASAFLGSRAHGNKNAVTTTNDVGSSEVSTHNEGLFGWINPKNRNKVIEQMAGIQNSKQSVEQTSHLQEQWANDPRNQRAVFNAKDGGIVPDIVHAKLSKGELYYDPYTKTLSRVPGSPNKPNTNDDKDALVKEGGMIVPNSEDQPLINGKTQAIALAPMIDKPGKKMSEGTIAARDAIVRKTVRRNEMAKLNKPENRSKTLYAAKGDIVPYSYNKDMSQFGYWDSDKNNYKKEYIDFVNSITEQDVKDIYSGRYGDMSTYLGKNKNYTPTVSEARQLMTDKKYGDWHKIAQIIFDSKSNAKNDITKVPATPIKTSVLPIYGGPKTGNPYITADQRVGDYTMTPYDTLLNTQRVPNDDYKKLGKLPKWSFNLLENENQNNNSKPGNFDDFGMLDAYQWLSALVPLMDREKAEKVTLSRPTWKGIPVGVDVLKQLQDAQLGYDVSNYSITQGGYTAGQQLAARVAAADNLARQRAAIHAWQTQQQNENIAKNIASYNDHIRLLSEINDREADMNAANRGAARNINRQNRSQAFKNIGQILRDKKQYDMDLIRTEILKPMIESVYENSDVVIPMLNKQIKKKSTKKSKGE